MVGQNELRTRIVRAVSCLPCLLGGVVLAQAPAGVAASASSATAALSYRVINLGAGSLASLPVINQRGQVTFTLSDASGVRALFYDGRSVRDIGTLGGPTAYTAGLNDAGQVAGFADTSAGTVHAFRWSVGGGMSDLGVIGGGPNSYAAAINKWGTVVGWSDIGSSLEPVHAFVWRPATGMVDLGNTLGDALSLSTANAINDAGVIAGNAVTGAPGYNNHAFYWTPGTGMLDLGILAGGNYSYTTGLDAQAGIVGWADVSGGNNHAFHWTRAHGLHDLGTADGIESFPLALSPGGQMVGVINLADGNQHAMSWTRAGGMRDLGTLGGSFSRALALNGKGLVVGVADTADASEPSHAFLWSPGRGMIDLNKRVRRLPAGLRLESADAIADDGSIVAETNAGLVLLKPDNGGCKCGAALGPISASEVVAAGAPFSASTSFADDDAAARHSVSWSWGDGAVEAGESAGAGSASARHVYTRPGVYTVTAQVSDGAGHSAAVSRNVVVVDPASRYAAGVGAFVSLPGAIRTAPAHSGKAQFAFFAPSTSASAASATSAAGQGAQPFLLFSTGAFSLRSTDFKAVALDGGSVRFEGSGRDKQGAGVSFSLVTASGTAAASRFALKVWRVDPVTHRQIVEYDNQAGTGRVTRGVMAEGQIAVQM